ncbi:MAG: hypothetical protein WKF91_10695 [Segetibacter sp.]
MKTMTQSAISFKKGLSYLMLFCLLAANFVPAPVSAQEMVKSVEPGAEISYIGVVEDKLVFGLKFKNELGEKFSVMIKNNEDQTFHHEKYEAKNFTKKYLFEKSEFGNGKLTFVISTPTGKLVQAFELNINTRVLEDVVVTRQ